MFKHIKTAFKLLVLVVIVLFMHYNLPDRDIVRIVDTEVSRVDKRDGAFGRGEPDAGTDRLQTIDVRYISTMRPNGKPMVYRNQDTGWGWPPYFKFDTGDLMARAQDYAALNGTENEVWVAVQHYGWRIKMFSLYPNAISIKEVEGPHVRLIPWFNIAFLTLLGLICLWIWLRIRRFKKKRIDPITDAVGEGLDAAGEKISSATNSVTGEINNKDSGFRRFMRKWFGSQ